MKYIVKTSKPNGKNSTKMSIPAQIVEQIKLIDVTTWKSPQMVKIYW